MILKRDSYYDSAVIKCLECGFEKTYNLSHKIIKDCTFEDTRNTKTVMIPFGHLKLPDSVTILIDGDGLIKSNKIAFDCVDLKGFIENMKVNEGNETFDIMHIEEMVKELRKVSKILKKKIKS